MAKMIGYYGNGQPKYDTDEQEFKKGGWSPSHNPNPYNRANLDRLNSDTYYYNNGIRKFF